ncbi:TetR/AcrR family transcriptional regulator [Catenuloplanes japonicus]|uniref:TetR/AcrR family transcriptional regulator n=1 Tax=Catenuloplanes japonicus TaxID=33876 RepID=UPI0005243C01|nr:TetR/AcrR family transcriptional regulator [Catenuloplanes japonicus]
MTTPRQRYRDQVRTEIKAAALVQIRAGGVAALSLNAIAKQLGVSGPALYKYYGSKDDLLTELIIEGYDSAALHIAEAASAVREQTPRARLHALAGAYRAWAVENPHRFELLAGTPSPTYQAPPETVDHARDVFSSFLPVIGAGRDWPAGAALIAQMRATDSPGAAEWAALHAPDADPALVLAGQVLLWSRLHGVVSLEVQGAFTGMGHDPATLLTMEMDSFADALGLP